MSTANENQTSTPVTSRVIAFLVTFVAIVILVGIMIVTHSAPGGIDRYMLLLIGICSSLGVGAVSVKFAERASVNSDKALSAVNNAAGAVQENTATLSNGFMDRKIKEAVANALTDPEITGLLEPVMHTAMARFYETKEGTNNNG